MYQGMNLSNSRWFVCGLPETCFYFLDLVTLVINVFVVNQVSFYHLPSSLAIICKVDLRSSWLNVSIAEQRFDSKLQSRSTFI